MHAEHADEPNALTGLWAMGELGQPIWRFARSFLHRRIFGCRPAL